MSVTQSSYCMARGQQDSKTSFRLRLTYLIAQTIGQIRVAPDDRGVNSLVVPSNMAPIRF